MADITLAELDGRVWLVGGEDSLDDLLANTLPPGITTEIVPCLSKEEVITLWVQHSGPPNRTGDPWLIHPAIVTRIRGSTLDHAVFFAQWSAMLDRDAETVIHAAAGVALSQPDWPVMLVEYRAPDAGRSLVELQRLRVMLVEERLQAEGVDASRIGRLSRDVRTVPGMGAESQRVDVVVREGA